MTLRLERPPEPTVRRVTEHGPTPPEEAWDIDNLEPGDVALVKTNKLAGFLWTPYWKVPLKEAGVEWNDFQQVGSPATYAVERWAEGEGDWGTVLERFVSSLEKHLDRDVVLIGVG